jgi:hypothetical protein
MDIEVTGTPSEIVEQLATITYGDHIVLIYPNQYSYREIYSSYCKTALENNEIVLLLTYYETIEGVRQTLKEIGIDTEKYEKERSLMIVQDITKTYFGSANDFLFFIKIFDKHQEKRGRNGISVFADMGVSFHHPQNDKKDLVLEFERSLGSKFDTKLKRFCNYHKKDFDRFEAHEKDNLLKSHHIKINMLS